MVILCHNALYFQIYCDKNRLVGKREFFTKCRILDFFSSAKLVKNQLLKPYNPQKEPNDAIKFNLWQPPVFLCWVCGA